MSQAKPKKEEKKEEKNDAEKRSHKSRHKIVDRRLKWKRNQWMMTAKWKSS